MKKIFDQDNNYRIFAEFFLALQNPQMADDFAKIDKEQFLFLKNIYALCYKGKLTVENIKNTPYAIRMGVAHLCHGKGVECLYSEEYVLANNFFKSSKILCFDNKELSNNLTRSQKILLKNSNYINKTQCKIL